MMMIAVCLLDRPKRGAGVCPLERGVPIVAIGFLGQCDSVVPLRITHAAV